MSEHLQFDPATMDPRAVYRLLVGSVVPRPIGNGERDHGRGDAHHAEERKRREVGDASGAHGRSP